MLKRVIGRRWSLQSASSLTILLLALTLRIGATGPPNDYFVFPTPIVGLTNFSVSNVGATAEANEPTHAGEPAASTLWWRWTAPYTGTFRVVTSNSVVSGQTQLDTVVAVYTGSLLTNLSVVVANDDTATGEFGALWSRVVFRAYAGETFRFAIGSLASQGTLRIDIGTGGPLMQPWQVSDLQGQPLASTNYLGKLVMIDFWETTCTACIEELGELRQVQELYQPKGFTFLGLSGDPDPGLVKDYLRDHPVNYPIAMSTPNVQRILNGTDVGYPTKFLIDPDGRVVNSFVGGGTVKIYRSMIDPLVRSDSRVRMRITRVEPDVRIAWPAAETGYTLQGGPGPNGPWSEVTTERVVLDTDTTVTFPPNGNYRFFRLLKR
jgi:thiol-disulfide isomerase/thioredoxin